MDSATRKIACRSRRLTWTAGFKLGQAYKVEVRPGRLVVRAV